MATVARLFHASDGTGFADLIIDGTDNFETRYLLNDVAISLGIPWVYGGIIGSYGMTMTIVPGAIAAGLGMQSDEVDRTVDRIDAWLASNRRAAEARDRMSMRAVL